MFIKYFADYAIFPWVDLNNTWLFIFLCLGLNRNKESNSLEVEEKKEKQKIKRRETLDLGIGILDKGYNENQKLEKFFWQEIVISYF